MSLKTVDIPASVTSIGESAFVSCRSLETITVASDSKYSVVDNCLIGHRESDGKIVAMAITKNFKKIPSTVEVIGDSLFKNSTFLAKIDIPSGVEEISGFAFLGCNLTSVTIPDTVTKIENSAFASCTKLTNVFIPSFVTHMGYGIFRNSPNVVISCEVASKGANWDEDWNKKDWDGNIFEVNWNATRP